MRGLRKILAAGMALAAVVSLAIPAGAAVHRTKHSHAPVKHQQKTEVQPYKGALIIDADSGKIIYELNPDMPWPPASMAKMMLLLVAEDQIKAGNVNPDDPVRISERLHVSRIHGPSARAGL